MARDVDLSPRWSPTHCCDFETIGAITPTHPRRLHANVHDPHGPDGVAVVVRHIKDKSNDLTRAEIMMRGAVAANVQQSDDVSLSVDECVVEDPMSSQRITEPGKGAVRARGVLHQGRLQRDAPRHALLAAQQVRRPGEAPHVPPPAHGE